MEWHRANPAVNILDPATASELTIRPILVAKDGRQCRIEMSGAPIYDEGEKVVGVVLIYRDVTVEKRTAKELVKIKKLESVGVLAGGIAHDFNNILAAILGNLELAEIYTKPNNKIFSLLQEAKKASLRAKGLTQQLLTFAKGGDPVKKTGSVASLITDSANFALHGSSVICQFNIQEDLWQVDVDAGQISQVIQIIIINGRDAMPGGGAIVVGCRNIDDINLEPVSLPWQKYIRITITDTGSGIPAKFIEQIFDPYFSTKQMGSGLGLAICHSIINKHNGSISVESKDNKGTKFTIYLPVSAKISPPAVEEESRIVGVETRANIMIMDDDAMIRNLLVHMLEQLGHKAIVAENGQEAIELYKQYSQKRITIDLFILDLTIPGGMGGKDVVKSILHLNAQAKIIVASGYANDPVMASYWEYGFVASIAKPFELTELEQVISQVL